MSSTIRVAIIGGGVAGASLIHALMKFQHLDVHIFESADEFKEAGMAFGIARNAQVALELIGPSAAQCLRKAGAVPMKGVRFNIGQGEWAGSMVEEVDEETQGKRLTSIVHRANLLQQLLADVPKDRMHASKMLKTAVGDHPITLTFTDGTTHECDILIGSDGIHSTVRKLILGESDPAASPRNTGHWLLMTLQPYDTVRQSLDPALIDLHDAREYGWAGNNCMLMHNILSDGAIVQFAIGSTDDGVASRSANLWHRDVSASEIRKMFRDWPPGLSRAVDELLCNQSSHKALYLWEHPKARTYVSGPMCVTGDAAHSTTPWQGSGGGMSIEDSLILSTLLGHAKSPKEAVVALQVYDEVRRPRTQRIVESSYDTGAILMGRSEGGLNPENIRPFISRWDFIIDIDMESHRDQALKIMDTRLGV
ncbi:hypothetical protein F5Y18DRAFT_309592 [Xylariaceae sp. FL1019]|nr:hypothetical protein F5Y18DRAFT_309592 [Xylariaceae sp. FL1019]